MFEVNAIKSMDHWMALEKNEDRDLVIHYKVYGNAPIDGAAPNYTTEIKDIAKLEQWLWNNRRSIGSTYLRQLSTTVASRIYEKKSESEVNSEETALEFYFGILTSSVFERARVLASVLLS